jgi:hypothetical protein
MNYLQLNFVEDDCKFQMVGTPNRNLINLSDSINIVNLQIIVILYATFFGLNLSSVVCF